MTALLIAALLVVASMTIWRPILGVCVLILALPSYLWRWTIAGIPTTFLELAVYTVVTSVLVAAALHRITLARPRWPRIAWILIALWSIAWIVATLVSPDLRTGFGALKAWWLDAMLVAAVLVVVGKSESERMAMISATVMSGSVVAAVGLYQMVFLPSTLQEGRLSSFFAPVANYAAMYLAPILVFTVAALTQRRLRRSWWFFAGLMGAALAATVSYGGYIAAAAGLALVWFALPPSHWKKIILGVGVGVGIVGIIFLSTTKNFDQHFDATRSSGKVREQIWTTSWALVTKHPVFGIGPNQFEVAYRQEIPKHYFPPLEWLVAQPHMLWLALWLEGGLLALLVAVYGAWRLLRALWRDMGDTRRRAVSTMSLAALLAILVHGFVDTPILKNDLVMLTTIFILLPFIGREDSQKTN